MEEHKKFWKVTRIDADTGQDDEVDNRVKDLNNYFKREADEDFLFKVEKLSKEEYEETEK